MFGIMLQFSVPLRATYPVPHPSLPSGAGLDRRQRPRRALHCNVTLIDNVTSGGSWPASVPGECLDISDGGLYLTVPTGYGVTIGQRYTFRLTIPEHGPEPGPMQVVSQQGLILRTELLSGLSGQEDRVGLAVRLTGQRSGVVPMPGDWGI